MFAQLLEDIRGLVIGRVFAYRPRRVEITPIETAATSPTATQTTEMENSKKRKRRRH
jgi:hypothetical protein